MHKFSRSSLIMALMLLSATTEARAAMVFVRGAANSVGIINQHPEARGEDTYDTAPVANGIYDRRVDVDPNMDPTRRFDRLPNYYDNNTQKKLDISLINGGYYCTPTSALALVRYWAADPRFPNLFDPTKGDTNRSVILELARLMDTDDLTDRPGADKQENHFGTLLEDVLPGLIGYFNARYPNKFKGAEKIVPASADTSHYNNEFGAAYDASIRRNIPVILELPGHSTVGIGFDDTFFRETGSHYRVNDPWNARANISATEVGRGRPIAARGVFGSEVEDLFGPGADYEYDESDLGPSPSGLPVAMHWVEPLEDAEVPEPTSACLAFAATACGLLSRAPRTTKRR